MEKIPGRHENTFLYAYLDYTYNLDDRYDKPVYRCSQRKVLQCKATAKENADSTVVSVSKVHNHPSTPLVVQQSRLIQRMLLLAEKTATPTQDIFNNVCRGDRAAAGQLSYTRVRTRMENARTKARPSLPHTLLELSGHLKNQDAATVATFKGHVVADDETVALIFTSDTLLALLNESSEVFVDGTFAVTPRVPPVAQLYSIHARFKDTGIATVFILCEARTTALYRAIWERIVQLAPRLSTNLSFIMSDYEQAAISAMREQFPQAKIHGCWFHFNQAVLRKWRQLRLHHAPRDILSVAMSLPLVRHENFWDGLTLIQEMAVEIGTDHPEIWMFVAYLQKTWYPLRKSVSIHGCSLRTNNLVEGFHSTVPRKLGGVHPNMWIFLENLNTMMIDQEINLDRLRAGQPVRRARPRIDRERDQKIAMAQSDIETGRLPVRHFLQSFGRYYRQVQYDAAQQPLDENVDNDLIGPEALDAQMLEPLYQRIESGDGNDSSENVLRQQPTTRAGRGRGQRRGRGRGRATIRAAAPVEDELARGGDAHEDLESEIRPSHDEGCEVAQVQAAGRGQRRGRGRGRATIRAAAPVEDELARGGDVHEDLESEIRPSRDEGCEVAQVQTAGRGPPGRVYAQARNRSHGDVAKKCAQLLQLIGNEDSGIPEDCPPATEDAYQLFVDDADFRQSWDEFEDC